MLLMVLFIRTLSETQTQSQETEKLTDIFGPCRRTEASWKVLKAVFLKLGSLTGMATPGGRAWNTTAGAVIVPDEPSYRGLLKLKFSFVFLYTEPKSLAPIACIFYCFCIKAIFPAQMWI